MAALLVGKALVAKNPKVHNNLWKQDVIKPFPSRFLKNSGISASVEPLEMKVGALSALSMFCNTSTTFVSPFTSTNMLIRTYSNGRDYERTERTERTERRPKQEYVNAETFAISNVEFQELEISPKGNGFVPMLYSGNILRMSTPSLRAPFGVRKYAANNGREEANLNLGFDETELSQSMLNAIKSLEQSLLQQAIEKASVWFPDWEDKSEEKIRNAFRSSLRPPKNPKFSPIWKLKIKGGNRPIDFYYNGDKTSMEEVVPFSKVSAIVELRGVWVMPESFGTSWTLLNCRIDEVGKPKEKRFNDEPNESQ